MSVPFFERGIVVPSGDRSRPIKQEAVPSEANILRRGPRLKRRPSFSPPGEGSGVASMKNRGQGGRREKGDERRVKRQPETKRQRRIKKNGGDKGKQ